MANEKEFDVLLGGKEQLPHAINLLQFSLARQKEMEVIKGFLDEPSGIKMAFQRLPKHMRRRIMSHNVKRLPRRLRDIHVSQQQKSGVPPRQKRPSRKFRRRPKNLLQEYVRRQCRISWLETHIWHAKRFHMIEKWGFKIPDRPCDKAFRACYRATTKHCLIQDITYYACIKLEGPSELLCELKSLCDSNNGLSVGAKAFLKGTKGGELYLYNDKLLKKCIGQIMFNWRPDNTGETRVLWIWCHPAFYIELIEALRRNLTSDSIKIVELKHKLNRFRLTGPLSQAVLQKALKPASFVNSSSWFTEYLKTQSDVCQKQNEFWLGTENCHSPGQFPSGTVLCLNIEDPRFNFPKKRTKAEYEFVEKNSVPYIENIPESISVGAIWDENIREQCFKDKLSTAELCNLRNKQLVPGTDIESDPPVIPVMLIQRPGIVNNQLVYGSGWDLIVPSGWGSPVWLSLIMWGARAGGLRETNSIDFEKSKPSLLQPDTKAGVIEENCQTELCRSKFFNLPPNKRINYNKLSIVSPFSCPWMQLIREWNFQTKEAADFSVLRNRKILQRIQECLTKKVKIEENILQLNSIVPVFLTMKNNGTPNKYAIICLPQQKDKNALKNAKNKIIEPLKQDIHQEMRIKMRKEHKVLLKRLRKRRVRAKSNGKAIPSIDKKMLEEYTNKMRKLWLPDLDTTNIRNSCGREIIGFITEGAFSFTIAKGKGVGYIAIGCLNNLINNCGDTILIRNTNSRVYKFAKLGIAM